MMATCWYQLNVKVNTRGIDYRMFSLFPHGAASEIKSARCRDQTLDCDDDSEDEDG